MADIHTSWTPPTHDVEGNEITQESIQGYVIKIERDGEVLPDVVIDDGNVTGYIIVGESGRYVYTLRIATMTHELGPFSEAFILDNRCYTYNRSAYNRRTTVDLCGE